MLIRSGASILTARRAFLLSMGMLAATVGAANEGQQTILAMLQQRVAQDPTHADSWRLIGRLHQREGRIAEAQQALERAVGIDPQNAAIHFDYGNLLREMQNLKRASQHYRRVYELAPGSSYATQLATQGIIFHPPPAEPLVPSAGVDQGLVEGDSDLLRASYEIKTFDSSDEVERRLRQLVPELAPQPDPAIIPRRLRTFIEFGALYNSNVTLAPISRQLRDADARSAQGFLNPEFELIFSERNGNRIGGLARGYFSVNQGNLSQFDLASFQPGAFLERDQLFGRDDLTGRLDYVYSLDLFGGDRLGDRHALTTSATSLRDNGDVVHAFWTISSSYFDDDGPVPAVDSLDGTANTLGISRFFAWESSWITGSSLGASVESVNTEGADFRYSGASINGDLTVGLSERVSLIPEASAGYRHYGDFTGGVDRDEMVWRVGGRLRWEWTPEVAASLVAGYDRFASENELFDADRTQAGIVITVLR